MVELIFDDEKFLLDDDVRIPQDILRKRINSLLKICSVYVEFGCVDDSVHSERIYPDESDFQKVKSLINCCFKLCSHLKDSEDRERYVFKCYSILFEMNAKLKQEGEIQELFSEACGKLQQEKYLLELLYWKCLVTKSQEAINEGFELAKRHLSLDVARRILRLSQNIDYYDYVIDIIDENLLLDFLLDYICLLEQSCKFELASMVIKKNKEKATKSDLVSTLKELLDKQTHMLSIFSRLDRLTSPRDILDSWKRIEDFSVSGELGDILIPIYQQYYDQLSTKERLDYCVKLAENNEKNVDLILRAKEILESMKESESLDDESKSMIYFQLGNVLDSLNFDFLRSKRMLDEGLKCSSIGDNIYKDILENLEYLHFKHGLFDAAENIRLQILNLEYKSLEEEFNGNLKFEESLFEKTKSEEFDLKPAIIAQQKRLSTVSVDLNNGLYKFEIQLTDIDTNISDIIKDHLKRNFGIAALISQNDHNQYSIVGVTNSLKSQLKSLNDQKYFHFIERVTNKNEKLDFSGLKVDDKALKLLKINALCSDWGISVNKLDLSNSFNISNSISHIFPNLTELDLSFSDFSVQNLERVACTSLKKLALNGLNFRYFNIDFLLSSGCSLESLELNACSIREIETSLNEINYSIKRLSVSYNCLTYRSVSTILSKFISLKYLCLDYNEFDIEEIESNPGIECKVTSCCLRGIDLNTHSSVFERIVMKNEPIELLDISYADIDAVTLERVLENKYFIRSLILNSVNLPNFESIIRSKSETMRTLECLGITIAQPGFVFSEFPALERLRFSTDYIDTETVINIINALDCLKSLHIWSTSGNTDNDFILSSWTLHSLRKFGIPGSTKFGANSIILGDF